MTVALELLRALGLRATRQRQVALDLLLECPGLPPEAQAHRAAALGVSRATLYRLRGRLHTPAGLQARHALLGPRWVCRACGCQLGPARDAAAALALPEPGSVVLELDGYCPCWLEEAPSRSTHHTSPWRQHRAAPVLPLRTREDTRAFLALVGWRAWTDQREAILRALRRHPQEGPATIARRVADEQRWLRAGARSAKRFTSALARPDVQVALAAVATRLPWRCAACDRAGSLPRPLALPRPPRFALVGAVLCCAACLAHGQRSSRSEHGGPTRGAGGNAIDAT